MSNHKATQDPDAELLRAIRRSDRRAFAELYRNWQPRLYGYLWRLLGCRETVEEVLDDVMFVVWKDARKFAGRSSVATWIIGIAYRRAMSAIRSASRHRARTDNRVDVESMPAPAASHDDLLVVALGALSSDHRQVIELTYFFGLSYREIADIAACPENTVKTRMYHARRRLRSLLPELAGDGGSNRRRTAGRDAAGSRHFGNDSGEIGPGGNGRDEERP